jgi:hypothetical protein
MSCLRRSDVGIGGHSWKRRRARGGAPTTQQTPERTCFGTLPDFLPTRREARARSMPGIVRVKRNMDLSCAARVFLAFLPRVPDASSSRTIMPHRETMHSRPPRCARGDLDRACAREAGLAAGPCLRKCRSGRAPRRSPAGAGAPGARRPFPRTALPSRPISMMARPSGPMRYQAATRARRDFLARRQVRFRTVHGAAAPRRLGFSGSRTICKKNP